MSQSPLKMLVVIGSLHRNSVTRIVLNHVAEKFRAEGCEVDVLDLQAEPLPLYNPDTAYDTPQFDALQARVVKADVLVLGTPDYHGSISSALKNFLDHFWHEFAGKLFVTIVASHEKGLTVTDQLRTVARQCYAWTLPYGVSFAESADVKDGKIVGEVFLKRLEMLLRDTRIYGSLLADQRRADLAATDHSFMARHRKQGAKSVN
jgi:FMN reductase